MFGWLSGGSSNVAFSNVNSNDLVMRTQNPTDKVVIGSGRNSNANATLYILQNSLGINNMPASNILLDVQGVFQVGSDCNVYVANTLSASNAAISNLTVGSITYSSAQAQDLSASNFTALNTTSVNSTANSLSASNASVATNLVVGSGIYPSSNNGATLGDATNRFQDLWLGGNSFHIGDTTMSQSSNGDLTVTDNTGSNLRSVIALTVQVGALSNNLALTQSNDGSFVVCQVNPDGSETPINTVNNIWSIGSNIGIGQSNPSQVLDIAGNVLVEGDVMMPSGAIIRGDSNASTLYINPDSVFNNVSVKGSQLLVQNRLGISTTSPQYPLDVTGFARLTNLMLSGNQLPFLVYNDFADPNQNIPWYGLSVPSTNSNTYLTGKAGIVFLTSNTPVVIDPKCAGLGLGTSNVNTLLQFTNADNIRKLVLQEMSNNQYQVMGIGSSSNTFVLQVPATNNRFTFFSAIDNTSSQELFSVQGNGNVKVGEGQASYKLDVDGITSTSTMLLVGDSVDTATTGRVISAGNSLLQSGDTMSIGIGKGNDVCNQGEITYQHTGDNSLSNAIILGLSGFEILGVSAHGVGINTTAPLYDLDVRGQIFANQDSTFSSNLNVYGNVNTQSITSFGSSNNVLSIGSDSNTGTINIGGSNTTINIGGVGDSVNIQGSLTWIDTVNTVISDKTIVINRGGATGTAINCGIQFEENSNIAGYILVNPTDDGFVMKAPVSSNTLTISLLSNISFNNALFISASNSNVGFGSAVTPAYSVHIQNSNTPTLYIETLSNDTASLVFANSNAQWMFNGPVSGSNNALQLCYQSNLSGYISYVTVQNDGKIGFGTDAPQYALDVAGTINATGILVNGQTISSGGAVAGGGGGASGWASQSSNIYTDCNVGIKTHNPRYELDVSGTVNASSFYVSGAPFTAGYWSVGDGFMYSLSNVGINVSSPGYTLDVGGTINAQNITVNGSSIASGFWQLSGGNVYSLSNVGVGTSIPTKPLDVVGDGRVTGNFATTLLLTAGSLSVSANALVSGNLSVTGAVKQTSLSWGDGLIFNNGNNRFYADAGLGSVVLNVDVKSNLTVSAGQVPSLFVNGSNTFVGIANSNPAYQLDVSGTINASNYVNVPWSGIVSKPAFQTVATSGSYLDLTNAPALCNVATTGSYLSLNNAPALCNVSISGSYLDLNHKPSLCNVATSASYFDLTNAPALCNVATTGAFSDLSSLPSGLSGIAPNDLSNFSRTVVFQQKVGVGVATPAYALDVTGAVNATSYCNVNWSNLVNKPALCNVSTTGRFTDLNSIQPLSFFTNDITSFTCNVGIKISNPLYTLHVGGAVYASTYCNLDWSMVNNAPSFARPSYSNLVDAPQDLSQLTNDLTSFSCNVGFGGNSNPNYAIDVTGAINATSYCNVNWSNLVNAPALCNIATTASWSDIKNKPTLSGLVNDLVYFGCNVGIQNHNPAYALDVFGAVNATSYCNITWSIVSGKPSFCNVATTSRYNDLVNTPSNLSQFTNDLSNFNNVQLSTLNVTSTITANTYCNVQWSMIQNTPAFTINYNQLSNKPAFCNIATSAQYSDLQGVPSLCNIAIYGTYYALPDIPSFSTIAYQGSNSYVYLTDTPALCNVSLTADYSVLVNKPTNLSQFTNDLSNFTNLTAEGDMLVDGNLNINYGLTVSNVAVFETDTETYGIVKASTITALDTDSIMNIGCTSNISTINIGNNSKTGHLINIGTTTAPGMSNVISIGGPTDTVYIPGGLVYVYESFLYTSNHTFTLNEGGQLGSAAGAGIFFDEGETSVSYMQISTDRNSFLMQTPTSTNDTTLDMSANQLTINGTLTTTSDTSNVGIGISTPSEKLQVQGGNIRIHNTNNTNGQTNALFLSHVSTTNAAKIDSYYKNGNIDVRFFTYSNGIQLQNMTLSSDSVGVGLSNPSVKLHVKGDISFNQTLFYRNELSSTWCNVKIIDVPYSGQVDYYVPSSSQSNVVLSMIDSGNVGIGSTAPTQSLDVAGNISTQGIVSPGGFTVNNISSTADGCPTDGLGYNSSNIVQLNGINGVSIESYGPLFMNTANVGIGTTSPMSQLHVVGSILTSVDITADTLHANTSINTPLLTATNVAACNIAGISNVMATIQQTAIRTSNLAFSNIWTTTTNGSNTTTTGNVGIGTTNPNYPLVVNGTMSATSYCNITYGMVSGKPNLSTIAYFGSNTYCNLTGTPSLCNIATSASWTDLYGKPTFATVATSGQYSSLAGLPTTLSNFTNNLTLFNNQIVFNSNVGIQTNSPLYTLDVSGTINACNILVNGCNLSSVITVGGYWQYNSAYEYTFSNVGIALTSPQTLLSVGNDFSITPCNNAWNTLIGKALYMRYSTWSNQDSAYIQSMDHIAGKYYNMSVEASNIKLGQANLTNPALFIGYNGKIGVGTTTPAQTLDVNGSINATTYCNVSYCNLINQPTYALVANSGKYSDLSNLPSYALVANSGMYSDLSNLPNLAPLAFIGSNLYSNLTGQPTTLSFFTNDLTSFSNAITFTSNVKFVNSNTNRTIVMYDPITPANSNQYTGFGINTGSLRYQVADTANDHVMYSGYSSNVSNELFRVKGTGNVGIGTSSPQQKLHVCSGSVQVDATATPILSLISSATSGVSAGEIQMYQSTLLNGWKIRNIAASNALNFVQWSNATEYSRIWVSSNVGIKTSTPLYDLDVNGTVNALSYNGLTYSMISGTPTFGSNAFPGSNTWSNVTGKPTTLSYFTNDLTNFANNVTFNSNIGIGVLSASYTLDVTEA